MLIAVAVIQTHSGRWAMNENALCDLFSGSWCAVVWGLRHSVDPDWTVGSLAAFVGESLLKGHSTMH